MKRLNTSKSTSVIRTISRCGSQLLTTLLIGSLFTVDGNSVSIRVDGGARFGVAGTIGLHNILDFNKYQ